MTSEEIARRCRKVFIYVCDNKIFDNGHGEYEFVNVFRNENLALQFLKGKLNQSKKIWEKEEVLRRKHEVIGFYLVPAKMIDNTDQDRKKIRT